MSWTEIKVSDLSIRPPDRDEPVDGAWVKHSRQAAHALSCSRRSLRRMVQAGRIQARGTAPNREYYIPKIETTCSNEGSMNIVDPVEPVVEVVKKEDVIIIITSLSNLGKVRKALDI